MLKYKAEILGLLCSDGNYRDYTTKFMQFDKRRDKSYPAIQHKRIIEFANTDFNLLKRFQDLIEKVYGYRPNIILSNHKVYRVCLTRKSIINDLTSYVSLGTEKWRVPRFVLIGGSLVKFAFIQGFFDGDGSVDFVEKTIPRVRISSTNFSGVKQLKYLLNNLKINCSLNGPYVRINRRAGYELLLKTRSIESFIKKVSPHESKKRNRFNKIAERLCRGRQISSSA